MHGSSDALDDEPGSSGPPAEKDGTGSGSALDVIDSGGSENPVGSSRTRSLRVWWGTS